MKPKKELGQNFLNNPKVVKQMVSSLSVDDGDTIIEIGPGLGALTQKLVQECAEKNCKIFAVELDIALAEKLEKNYFQNEKIDIVQKNFLDWIVEFDEQETQGKVKIIGSLPYYITSPIMHSIIYMKNLPEICVLLIQKEVAQRISAIPPKSTYLSAFVQNFYNVEYLGTVNKTNFNPIPKVDGGIIKLSKILPQIVTHEEKRKLEGFLHKGFSNPRKMLNKAFSSEELTTAQIDGSLRPQNLTAIEWANAYKKLIQQ